MKKKICKTTTMKQCAIPAGALSDCGQKSDNDADLIVYGTIYTADKEGTFAEAFAVKDGKYIYVGDANGAKAFIGKNTQRVDAGFVMPSAVESHAHYILEEAFKLGLYIDSYNKDGSPKTTDELAQDIAAYRKANPDSTGIYGYGWNKVLIAYQGETVTREAIDKYISDIPVYISGSDLHCGWCNTKCLEMAGALHDEIPSVGVVRDENGTATGRINDEACAYVRNAVFGEISNYDKAVLNAQKILLGKGYTMTLDAWSNFDGTSAMYDAVKAADENGNLNMVVFASYSVNTYTGYDEEIEKAVSLKKEKATVHFDPKFIKLFVDGTEETRTAYLLEPYPNGSHGTDNWSPDDMNHVVTVANKAGLLVHTHAYGDASARQTIDAYEKSNKDNNQSYRNSIGHAPYIADTDIQRIADLEIGISGSGNWGIGRSEKDNEIMEKLLGYDRYHNYYIVDKWAEYGVKAGMSTDRPCADGYAEDVFDYIGMLTTGVDYREGKASPAKREKWVSVENAVRMMTINGAWSLSADAFRGSIEVGKYADFIFADGNPFETELNKIHTINVNETYFEGRRVFARLK